jgi:hypothetical protein
MRKERGFFNTLTVVRPAVTVGTQLLTIANPMAKPFHWPPLGLANWFLNLRSSGARIFF